MFTDYLIKVVRVEMLAFALALIKSCWVAKSIAGLPNIRKNYFTKQVKLGYGGFWLDPISTTFPAASKNNACFKRLKNNHHTLFNLSFRIYIKEKKELKRLPAKVSNPVQESINKEWKEDKSSDNSPKIYKKLFFVRRSQ
jgi:hypothetical protein